MTQTVNMTGDTLQIDGVTISGDTAGTVSASKPVIVDAAKDLTGGHNWTITNMLVGTGGSFSTDSGTATATAGAATLNKMGGAITTESLTTAAGATYTLTLTNSAITTTSKVFASVRNGSSTTGMPCITTITQAGGSVVIVIQNIHASAAFNGTLIVNFMSVL